MKIETKYNIGDKVWLMWNNKAVQSTVKEIFIEVKQKRISEEYALEDRISEYHRALTSGELFPTKEELLKSL